MRSNDVLVSVNGASRVLIGLLLLLLLVVLF